LHFLQDQQGTNAVDIFCIPPRLHIQLHMQAAYEEVKSVLTDSKLLLKFAALSVIEALRTNPELCNFVLHNTSVVTASNTTYGSNYLSLTSGRQDQQQQSFNDTYIALILEEAEKLYNELTTELTDRAMTTAIMTS
jgi:hypothetical protein